MRTHSLSGRLKAVALLTFILAALGVAGCQGKPDGDPAPKPGGSTIEGPLVPLPNPSTARPTGRPPGTTPTGRATTGQPGQPPAPPPGNPPLATTAAPPSPTPATPSPSCTKLIPILY